MIKSGNCPAAARESGNRGERQCRLIRNVLFHSLRLRAEGAGRAAFSFAVCWSGTVDGAHPFFFVLRSVEETVCTGGHGRMVLPAVTWNFA